MIFNQNCVYALLVPGAFCLLSFDLSIFVLYRLLSATIRKMYVYRIVSPLLGLLGFSWFLFYHLCPLCFVFMRFLAILMLLNALYRFPALSRLHFYISLIVRFIGHFHLTKFSPFLSFLCFYGLLYLFTIIF